MSYDVRLIIIHYSIIDSLKACLQNGSLAIFFEDKLHQDITEGIYVWLGHGALWHLYISAFEILSLTYLLTYLLTYSTEQIYGWYIAYVVSGTS